jgi:predicted transcriptional regulator
MRGKNYDLKMVMKEEMLNGSINLVTRETGVVIREKLERELTVDTDPTVTFLDFSGVGVVDYSCADEVIAKLISRLLSGEYGDKFIVLKGLSSNQMENIEVALERKKLAIFSLQEAGEWPLVSVMEKGSITLRELADEGGIGLNTGGTRLLNLYKKRLIWRSEEVSKEGGRQFVYKSLMAVRGY